MTIPTVRTLGVFLLAGGLSVPMPLLAQPAGSVGQEAQKLVEQLRPRTRGIRLPGNDAAPASAPQPGETASSDPIAPASSDADLHAERIAAPVETAPSPRLTTAPADVPAVSIIVRFATGSATLTPDAIRALAPLGEALNAPGLAPYRFRIEGHTDTVGSVEMNQILSGRRALAVRELLVRHYGVDPARLEAVGYGDTQLLVPTPQQTAEPRNRRVQVLNISG